AGGRRPAPRRGWGVEGGRGRGPLQPGLAMLELGASGKSFDAAREGREAADAELLGARRHLDAARVVVEVWRSLRANFGLAGREALERFADRLDRDGSVDRRALLRRPPGLRKQAPVTFDMHQPVPALAPRFPGAHAAGRQDPR